MSGISFQSSVGTLKHWVSKSKPVRFVVHLKYQEIFIQQHSITSQKTWSFSNLISYKFHVAIIMFYILHPQKCCISKIYCHASFKGHKLSREDVTVTSESCCVSHVALWSVWNRKHRIGLAFNVRIFISDFVKIEQLVWKLKWGAHTQSMTMS